MSYKIAIDNGHGMNTAGKRTPIMAHGRAIREWEFNYPAAKKLGKALKRCGIDVVFVSDTDQDTALSTRTRRANDAGADLFISIHYNAFKGVWGSHGGVEVHHYPTSTVGKRLAGLVQGELVKATGLRDRGIKATNFYVLRNTKMAAILCECGFMDNLEEAKLMLDDGHQERVAEAITRGVCTHLGISYVPGSKPKPSPKPDEGILYRVQVGAFAIKANAESLAKELNDKGYDTHIVTTPKP